MSQWTVFEGDAPGVAEHGSPGGAGLLPHPAACPGWNPILHGAWDNSPSGQV